MLLLLPLPLLLLLPPLLQLRYCCCPITTRTTTTTTTTTTSTITHCCPVLPTTTCYHCLLSLPTTYYSHLRGVGYTIGCGMEEGQQPHCITYKYTGIGTAKGMYKHAILHIQNKKISAQIILLINTEIHKYQHNK